MPAFMPAFLEKNAGIKKKCRHIFGNYTAFSGIMPALKKRIIRQKKRISH